MRDPVLFRVDATPASGYESLARCLIFAAALQRRRRPAYFLSKLDPGFLGLNLKRAGNEWLDADGPAGSGEDLEETLREIRRLRPTAVVVDSPSVDENYLSAVRDQGVLLVSLDHHAAVRNSAHLLVNPLMGPDKEMYEFSPETQILMGPRYSFVRSEVRKCRAIRAQEPAKLQDANGKISKGRYRVLVSLGEDDPHNQTTTLAKLLLSTPKIGKVDLAVRPHHAHLDELQELALDSGDRLEVAVEPAEIAARIVRCHFAVTAGNGWSLELAAVGVPQLIIVQDEAFWPTAQRLEEEGCVACLGWRENVSAATIRNGVSELLGDPYERQAMARCGRQLIDARGPDRLINGLEVMLHPAGREQFRTAA